MGKPAKPDAGASAATGADDKTKDKNDAPQGGDAPQPSAGDPPSTDQGDKTAKAAKPEPKPKAEPKAKTAEELYEDAIEELMEQLDEKEQKLRGAELFVEACLAFGINPNPNARPIEILAGDGGRRWRFIEGSEVENLPDRVVFVTAGGVKLSHPMDQESHDRMLSLFGRKGVDAKGQQVDLPLPGDLTLPRPFVTGVPPRQPDRAKVPELRAAAQRAVLGKR